MLLPIIGLKIDNFKNKNGNKMFLENITISLLIPSFQFKYLMDKLIGFTSSRHSHRCTSFYIFYFVPLIMETRKFSFPFSSLFLTPFTLDLSMRSKNTF